MPRLRKDQYDFYYLIFCSRGPGTETITVHKVPHNDIGGVKFDKELPVAGQVRGAYADWTDEGYLIAVPEGTLPLDQIFLFIAAEQIGSTAMRKKDLAAFEKQIKTFSEKDKEFFTQIGMLNDEVAQALFSATCRVFLQKPIPESTHKAKWTSVNGWRRVDLEVLSKRQFDLLVKSLHTTVEELEKWDCAVMKKTCSLYRKGKLPKKDFRGC